MTQKIGDALFKLLVDVLCATDKTDARQAVAVRADGFDGRFYHGWVTAEAQVVVGAKVQHFGQRRRADDGALGRGDDALLFVQACVSYALYFGLQRWLYVGKHDVMSVFGLVRGRLRNNQ
jgi:hypothetical protein